MQLDTSIEGSPIFVFLQLSAGQPEFMSSKFLPSPDQGLCVETFFQGNVLLVGLFLLVGPFTYSM